MEVVTKNLIQTIAFFDLFNYPLTAWELWRLSPLQTDFIDVVKALETLPPTVATDQGFYFLAGRQELIAIRKKTYNLANQKNKIALKTIKKLRHLPGLKLIAVCNNFYYTPTSDIDLFIITQKQRLWLTRLLVTIATHLLGRRRHGRKITNRLCLSFYVSEAQLNLESITLETDPYFYYWLAFLSPLYGAAGYDQFWQANDWLANKLPNLTQRQTKPSLCLPESRLRPLLDRCFNSWPSQKLERLARKLQLAKMAANTTSLAHAADTRVIISETILKFHENDRRQYFCERYQQTLKQLNYD